MIENIWKKIHIYCGNHGDDYSIKMVPHEQSQLLRFGGGSGSIFYACPKYYAENRNPDETACFNRISITELEEMVEYISDQIESPDSVFAEVNLKGLTWKNKHGTRFKIINFSSSRIDVLVYSQKSLRT